MPYFDELLLDSLKKPENVNLVARDPENGEILGVVMVNVGLDEEVHEENTLEKSKTPRCRQISDKMQTIFTFLDWVKRDLNVKEKYNHNEIAEVMFLTCNIERRVPGLGTELTRKATEATLDAGIKAIYTTATSHFSGKIFLKLGYDLVTETPYSEYKIDGNIVFPTSGPHTHVKLLLKELK